MINDAHIAVAWGSPAGATAEISIAIEEITGKRQKPVRLGDLAGPNETIQILLSSEDWVLVAKAVAAIYGAELIKEAAKSTWKSAAPKFDQLKDTFSSLFGKLIRGISNALNAKAYVILGFYRTPVGARRNIGIEIKEKNPEEIARVISILAANGDEIERKLDELEEMLSRKKYKAYYDENSDCSVKLAISEDGNVQLSVTISDDNFVTSETFIYELTKKELK